jgi:hypothetical protein
MILSPDSPHRSEWRQQNGVLGKSPGLRVLLQRHRSEKIHSPPLQEFLESFDLKDHLYTKRFYDTINVSLTGFVSFKEFVTRTWDFLVFDKRR